MRVRTHTNPFSVSHRFDKSILNFIDDSTILDVEIGFGRGVFLRYWASCHPEHRVVGVEVRHQIVEILNKRVVAEGIENVNLFHGNGHHFCEDCVPDCSVDRFFVFHPDPWFKKRHHKRRVITDDFVSLMFRKLKINGCIYVSTDVQELWDDMTDIFSKASLVPLEDNEFWHDFYRTHWHSFSIKDKRSVFYQTFQKI